MMKKGLFLMAALVSLTLGCTASTQDEPRAVQEIGFHDVKAQTPQFIGYYHAIKLSPEQERIRDLALGGIPAPCCSDYPASTCCCDCNLAKSIWGLSNYLIAEQGYDADAVRAAVGDWIGFTNPRGYAGNACYTPGGCTRPFGYDGCGGMSEGQLIL